MPIIEIKMWAGRDARTKQMLIEEVSATVARVLKIEIDRIELIITDVSKENWGKRGKQASSS